jgi:Domain of unknown function (DUF4939)
MSNHVEALQAQLNELSTRFNELGMAYQTLVQERDNTLAPRPQTDLGRVLPNPPPFDGKDRSFCDTFISQLNLYMSGNPTAFSTDKNKVTFAAAHLRGLAYKWFEPHLLIPDDPILADYRLFTEELRKHLGDANRKRNADRQLRALAQTGSASNYATEFFKISASLGWNDEALMSQFYTGLKTQVKDALAILDDESDNVQTLAEKAIRLDNRLFERSHEDKPRSQHKPNPSNPQQHIPSPTEASTDGSGTAPMEVDATQPRDSFKPLTPAEKDYRMKNHLCLYCGRQGHNARECPAKRKPIFAKATLSPTTQGAPLANVGLSVPTTPKN